MGVVFAITIPREAERKAFEQDAILNSVYEAYHGSISTFELSPRRFTFSVGVIPDLIPHAPSSTGPVLFTMAKVKLWTHPASTMSRTVQTKLAADVLLRVDRHSFLVAASLCGRINHATWYSSLRTKNGNGTSRPACADSYTWCSRVDVIRMSRRSSFLGPGLRSPYGHYYNGRLKRRIGCGITSRLVPKRLPTPRIHPFTVETT
jgi:hypothetical protein